MRTYVIAEAGVNHNGSMELARKLIDAAARAGADAVKFQTFKSELLVTDAAEKAAYQKATTGGGESQAYMIRKLELRAGDFAALAGHCRARGVQFLSTPFDVPSVTLLADLAVPLLKVPSGEITNPFLLQACARTGLPLLVSTGMSTLADVEAALAEIAGTWLACPPDAALSAPEAQRLLAERVTLFHCTTEYPAPLDEVNLRAMGTLREAFGLKVGYSDHTDGVAVPTAAVALGATVIEKHFTLDRNLPGPDHKASLEPHVFADMVRSIRDVERALGSSRKAPTASELPNMKVARRSLVAARPIAKGEALTLEAMTAKRPGGGLSPMRYRELVGRPASRAFAKDEALEP
jgi:N-acetylneuraminate synthase